MPSTPDSLGDNSMNPLRRLFGGREASDAAESQAAKSGSGQSEEEEADDQGFRCFPGCGCNDDKG